MQEVFAKLDNALPSGGDERICIAVLDGPVDGGHPCFRGAQLTFLDTLAHNACGGAASAHGTHVASIIFGQPGGPVRGIAPNCRGLIVPIFADRGDTLASSQLDLARAILLAVEHGAHIINISGGQLAPSGEPEPILAQAIETCARHNVLIVAAAGNDGCDCLHIPAAAPSVLAVGAMDRHGLPLESSNWGSIYGSQGLLAPGADVTVGAPGGGTALKSGTSFATPVVSGIAARLASLQLARGGPADPHAVRAALLRTALPCIAQPSQDCRRFLSGRINVAGAIREIMEGNKTMTDTDIFSRTDVFSSADLSRAFQPSEIAFADPGGHGAAGSVQMSDEQPTVQSLGNVVPASATADFAPGITPSDCGCGCGGKGKKEGDGEHKCSCGGHGGEPKKPQLVYALGKLGYDFGSEARRDSLIQAGGGNNPLLPEEWLRHLETNPFDAPAVIWTLNLDATPIYAVQPVGPYAASGYERLREALRAQLVDGVELVSIPGVIGGSARLQSGQVVPVIVPAIRGMYSWATKPLVAHVLGVRPDAADAVAERANYDRTAQGLTNFLDRVYYDLRNLGITGEERALNYSATNASQIANVIESTTRDQLDLDRLGVKRSPVCRPDSECYDVELSFFNPNNTNIANRVFRFTVDVSDVVPVTVGPVRNWTRRA